MVNLLVAIGVILFVLWVFGLITSYTFGGYQHFVVFLPVVNFSLADFRNLFWRHRESVILSQGLEVIKYEIPRHTGLI